MTEPTFDTAYRDAFAKRLTKAIFDVSMREIDGQTVCYMRAAELIDAMITNAAILMRDSEGTSTPARTRQFCDELARKLQRRIAEAKRSDVPFETVNADWTH